MVKWQNEETQSFGWLTFLLGLEAFLSNNQKIKSCLLPGIPYSKK